MGSNPSGCRINFLSRTGSPGSKTRTKGPKEPGQKTDSVLVIVTLIFNFDYYVFEN